MLGLVLIGIGVLIAVYPQILVAAVAGFFILSGLGVLTARWVFRRTRHSTVVRWLWW